MPVTPTVEMQKQDQKFKENLSQMLQDIWLHCDPRII